jgi:hypothetical protein
MPRSARGGAYFRLAQRNNAIRMMIGIGTPSSHSSIPRPMFSPRHAVVLPKYRHSLVA